jgi:anti-sigma factor RsiW
MKRPRHATTDLLESYMVPCPTNSEWSAYHDGELDERRRRELAEHLAWCAACVAQLNELQMLSGMFAAATVPVLSPIGVHRLHNSVEGVMDQGLLRLARAMSAIAACVLLVGSFWLTRMRDEPSNSVTATAVAAPWVPIATNQDEASVQSVASPVGQWYLADASQAQRVDDGQ